MPGKFTRTVINYAHFIGITDTSARKSTHFATETSLT
jgi:hypothetical protein